MKVQCKNCMAWVSCGDKENIKRTFAFIDDVEIKGLAEINRQYKKEGAHGIGLCTLRPPTVLENIGRVLTRVAYPTTYGTSGCFGGFLK